MLAFLVPAVAPPHDIERRPPAVRVSFEKAASRIVRVPRLLPHIDLSSHERIMSGSMPIVAAPHAGTLKAARMPVILRPQIRRTGQLHPRIYQIEFSTDRLEANVPVHVRVLVSDDVDGVYVRLARRFEVGMPPAGSGTFESSDDLAFVRYTIFARDYTLPAIPAVFRGRVYTLEFVAIARDGRAASANVPIYVAR